MTMAMLDVFYMFMIIVIFGFIVHLETEMKILITMMKEHTRYRTPLCEKDLKDLENRLDKLEEK
jgi:hypothetical protein